MKPVRKGREVQGGYVIDGIAHTEILNLPAAAMRGNYEEAVACSGEDHERPLLGVVVHTKLEHLDEATDELVPPVQATHFTLRQKDDGDANGRHHPENTGIGEVGGPGVSEEADSSQ